MTLKTLIKILSGTIFISRFMVIFNLILSAVIEKSGKDVSDLFLIETLIFAIAWYASEASLEQAKRQLETDTKNSRRQDPDESND